MDLSGLSISSIKDILSLSSRNIFSIAFFVGIVGLLFLHLPQSIIALFYIDSFRIANLKWVPLSRPRTLKNKYDLIDITSFI